MYLGEARRDGELLILGVEHEDTLVRFWPHYTAFDLYLAEQAGLVELSEAARLEDLESGFFDFTCHARGRMNTAGTRVISWLRQELRPVRC